jgi:hypothetical protein
MKESEMTKGEKCLAYVRAIKLDDDGVPVDAKDWTEADWAELHHGIQAIKARIAARHVKEKTMTSKDTRPQTQQWLERSSALNPPINFIVSMGLSNSSWQTVWAAWELFHIMKRPVSKLEIAGYMKMRNQRASEISGFATSIDGEAD